MSFHFFVFSLMKDFGPKRLSRILFVIYTTASMLNKLVVYNLHSLWVIVLTTSKDIWSTQSGFWPLQSGFLPTGRTLCSVTTTSPPRALSIHPTVETINETFCSTVTCCLHGMSPCYSLWPCPSQCLSVQRFAGWLSQILRREFTHARNFNSKSSPKVGACADSRCKFVTTNLQTSVQTSGPEIRRPH